MIYWKGFAFFNFFGKTIYLAAVFAKYFAKNEIAKINQF